MNSAMELVVRAFWQWFDAITNVFEAFLKNFDVAPKYFAIMFPPVISTNEIMKMWNDHTFPRLSELAPALTYAVIFGIIRFLLQYYIVKVRIRPN